MVNRPKRKGTEAETAVVSFLRESGWPSAERRALQGAKDRGDITGVPGVAIEVKSVSEYEFGKWLKELQVEVDNAGAAFGFVAAKPRGVGGTRTGRWFAYCRWGDLLDLLLTCNISTEGPDGCELFRMSGSAINRDIGPWMHTLLKATADASGRSNGRFGIILVDRRGFDDPKDFYAVTSLGQMLQLLNRAGYGSLGGRHER